VKRGDSHQHDPFRARGSSSVALQPGDLQAAMAAVEAFVGLLIEIVFIVTFTPRFFGSQ
jgi:hypothetical protein